jgi:hypothetical protein
MKTFWLAVVMCSASAAFADCPLDEARIAKVTGKKVLKREQRTAVFNTEACVFTMESGSIQLSRLSPQSRNVKTDDELAASYETSDKRRRLKDFPVPAYSFTGGVNVFTSKGPWQVLVVRGGPDDGLDAMKLAKEVVEATSK